jgi:hypothetical protein
MQYRICDNHPAAEIPAVVTEKLSLNGARVELDLCQACSDELYSTFCRWADIGTTVGRGTIFDGQRKIDGPVVIDLTDKKPKVPERPVVISEEEVDGEKPVVRQMPTVPHTASRWVFIDHAVDRLNERKLDVDDVLHAAERPEKVLPSKQGNGRRLHFRGDVCAVVDPIMHEIITAYDPRSQEEDFEFTPAKKAVGAR